MELNQQKSRISFPMKALAKFLQNSKGNSSENGTKDKVNQNNLCQEEKQKAVEHKRDNN